MDPKNQNYVFYFRLEEDSTHARARRVQIPKRVVMGLLTAIVLFAIGEAGLFIFSVKTLLDARSDTDSQEVARELDRATEQVAQALARASRSAAAAKARSSDAAQDVLALEQREADLAALAAGQDEIARAHKRILAEEDPSTIVKVSLFNVLLGVIGSLLATAIVTVFSRRSKNTAG